MKKIIYHGKYLKLSEENIAGHIYERVSIRNGIRILPMENNKIIFIKEYRKHENKSSIKLISGWIDKKSKSALTIAKEELKEEASMKAKYWETFYIYNTNNSTVEENITYFIAKELTKLKKQINPDHDIVEEIVALTELDLLKKLRAKEILWGKDITVVLMLFKKLGKYYLQKSK